MFELLASVGDADTPLFVNAIDEGDEVVVSTAPLCDVTLSDYSFGNPGGVGLTERGGVAARWKIGNPKSVEQRLATAYINSTTARYVTARESDGEIAWETIPTTTSSGCNGLDYINGTWLYRSIWSPQGAPTAYGLYRSTDDGKTWVSTAGTPGTIPQRRPHYTGTRWIIPSTSGSQTAISSGPSLGALSFTLDDIFGSGAYDHVASDGSGTVVIASSNSGTLLRSTDDGASGSWTTVSPGGGASRWVGLVYFDGKFVGAGVAGGDAFVAHSADGVSWTFATTILDQSPVSVAANSNCVVIAAAENTSTWSWYRSFDGTSWTLIDTETGPNLTSPRLKTCADGYIYLTFGFLGGGPTTRSMHRSLNGNSWTKVFDLAGGALGVHDVDFGPITPPRDHILQVRPPGGGSWVDMETVIERRRSHDFSGPTLSADASGAFISSKGAFSVNGSTWAVGGEISGVNFTSSPASAAHPIYVPWLGVWAYFGPTSYRFINGSDPNDSTVYSSSPSTQKLTVVGEGKLYQLRYSGSTIAVTGLFESVDGHTWTQLLDGDPSNFAGRAISSGTRSLSYAKDTGTLGLYLRSTTGTISLLAYSDPSNGFNLVSSTVPFGTEGGTYPVFADGCFYVLKPRTSGGSVSSTWRLALSSDMVDWQTINIDLPSPMVYTHYTLRCSLAPDVSGWYWGVPVH